MFKVIYHIGKYYPKKDFGTLHFIQIDTLCCYLSLHCQVHFEMCHDPTLLYGPILLRVVISRNVSPYYVISHSCVIWNSGVMQSEVLVLMYI